MGKSKGPSSGEEFLRAFWQEVRAVEKEHEVVVDVEMHPTAQVGVWCVHMWATGTVPGVSLLAPLARTKATYPAAQNATLEGFLFGQAMKLGQMVAEVREAFRRGPNMN